MPIIEEKNVEIEHKDNSEEKIKLDVILASFGVGDLGIANTFDDEGNMVGIAIHQNKKRMGIGQAAIPRSFEETKPNTQSIQLRFTGAKAKESLDVLYHFLDKVKARLSKEPNSGDSPA